MAKLDVYRAEALTYAQKVRLKGKARAAGVAETDWTMARALARDAIRSWVKSQAASNLSEVELYRAASSAAAQLLLQARYDHWEE